MTKKKSTKHALIMSALSLLLCISMLVGSTYAWFTDEVTSTGNKIEAGTLKIDLLVKDGDEYTSVKESQKAIFDYALWEPGYSETVNVKVANMGTLALQYNLQIVTEGLVQELLNQEVMLSDAIDVYYASEEILLADRDAFNSAVAAEELKLVGTLTDVIFGGTMISDTLLPGFDYTGAAINAEESADYATIVLKMRESAGNEYQGLSVGTKFDLKLFATQYTYEEDSFDNQYDKIELPAATLMIVEPELLDAYALDAGCVCMTTEEWNDAWGYDSAADQVNAGTPKYAYYFADFVVSVAETEEKMTLWGMYGSYGEQEFEVTDFEGGKEYRIIEIADDALPFDMGHISYRQLLDEVQTFACGVKGLEDGNTITVTLRLYETSLSKENANGTFSFEETGAYHDIAVYTYTK